MANELYDAFVKAGFEREVKTLSETVNGERKTGLGHYVAIYNNKIRTDSEIELNKKAMSEISSFLIDKYGDSIPPHPISNRNQIEYFIQQVNSGKLK